MSKTILVHRKLSFAQMSHTDSDVADWFNQAFKALSPYWKGKVVGTGLTLTEQRLLLPYMHGTEPDEREFRKKTEEFYDSLLTKVPPQGLKLEIGLEDDGLPVSADNMPLNIQDYIIYRHALGHPHLATTRQEADRSPIKHFYIHDPAVVSSTGIEINKLEDDALACYFKYKDDEVKVDQILTLSGVNIKKMTLADKIIKFKSLAIREAGKNEIETQHTLKRFVDLCEDPDLMVKYLIQEMVGAQVLERQGTTIFMKESGEAIGANIKEATAFLKNPKNSRIYNMLRAQYENLVRKGEKLPEIPEAILPEQIDIDPIKETGRKKAKPLTD